MTDNFEVNQMKRCKYYLMKIILKNNKKKIELVEIATSEFHPFHFGR